MERKVKVKFATKNYYSGYYTDYKQKTFLIQTPVNKYGAVQMDKVTEQCKHHIECVLGITDYALNNITLDWPEGGKQK